MATSKISSNVNLRIIFIPSNLFSWNTTGKYFYCSASDFNALIQGFSVMALGIYGNGSAGSGTSWGINYNGSSNANHITVAGYVAKTGESISDTGTFTAYVLGYYS